ncbi:response regulator transcription factor [Paenibacillus sp. PAMC21692]|uniref:response regulator transcription factor n=1 Tax=Paenibacillus sp. PAMC21692 TaxID=2762320 RepID=UPI00164D64F7|nr:response regulator transcription factor [Paenibacillus sp. PAMC21692]QNK55021.1 response regulator transcription factor [Paenibacillus sp. PAMC21692]
MKKVFVVEDDFSIARLLQVYLERDGFAVKCHTGERDILEVFQAWRPDLVLLDLMLEETQGMDILRHIREKGSCPVIIVSARGSVPDRLEGLQLGADDYIAKPFDPEEAVARVKAVLRRSAYLADSEVVRLGSLIIDYTAQTAARGQTPVALIPRDLQLLAFLARHPNQYFSREQLLDRVWGLDFAGGDRAVDAAIKRIRKSLQEWPESEGEIVTFKGTGYSLRVY